MEVWQTGSDITFQDSKLRYTLRVGL